MTDIDPVTEFVADYTHTASDDWQEEKSTWRQNAVDTWLEAARQRGIEASIRELLDSNHEVAVVEVDGLQYTLANLGRRMEVQAERR
ncbi:hypothetical protein AB0L82_22160 [Nocardia sp. NPDC052001]|uniref:hypothetical protein n=1 Tax=Nocardia sp. NPDC052001 TaxID=3154853 RepID=UPI003448A3B1